MTVMATPLSTIVNDLRVVVVGSGPAALTAEHAAAELMAHAPDIGLIPPALRAGDPERLSSHVLHAESGFSVVALVLGPGQQTTIHDHLAWGTVAVLSGAETETMYAVSGSALTTIGRSVNVAGSVTAFAPPGDIHRVRNDADVPAISLHVYGVDLRVVGSSVRRTYDPLPGRP